MPFLRKKLILIAGLFLLLVSDLIQAKLPPLIPREVLFGNPEKAMARISPDGQYYTYLAASSEDVLNIWLQDINHKSPPVMITTDKKRGIRWYTWAENNQYLLYLQDIDGDENWHLYLVDIANKVSKDLTPFPGVRASNLMLDKNHPNEVLIGLNKRDRSVFDMYRVDLTTGKITLDTENPGDVTGWLADNNFEIRAALVSNSHDGSSALQTRSRKENPWKTIMTWPFGANGNFLGFDGGDQNLYLLSNLDSDTTELQLVEANTGKKIRTLANDPKSDLSNVLFSDVTKKVQAVQFDFLKPRWEILDKTHKAFFDKLIDFAGNDFQIVSRNHDESIWLFVTLSDDRSTKYYLYDTKKDDITFLFDAHPELSHYKLTKMKPIMIKASDGMSLVSYLSLPVGVPEKNLPMVLNVHGGPWIRDSWGYDPTTQWFANLGYAVLQVNYRGSTGFGKAFLNAGNKQWGRGAMQQDLTDAVRWAIKEGIADPKKICIYGGSYGGYAVLAGLTFTPDLYACGVDIVGPTNLKTLLATIPPYWEVAKKRMLLRIGDVENDEAFNRLISPLFHVDNIKVPLLIAQGAHDPRVKMEQADMIVEAMRKKQLNVEYIVYQDEGHGFARPENRFDFYGRAENFLSKELGGRARPWQPVEGASAELH